MAKMNHSNQRVPQQASGTHPRTHSQRIELNARGRFVATVLAGTVAVGAFGAGVFRARQNVERDDRAAKTTPFKLAHEAHRVYTVKYDTETPYTVASAEGPQDEQHLDDQERMIEVQAGGDNLSSGEQILLPADSEIGVLVDPAKK